MVVLDEIKELVTRHLKERGLKLSEEKTLTTHINQGFHFLGWTFKKLNSGLLLTTPSSDSFKRITEKLKSIIIGNIADSQTKLIKHLNPTISRWNNNHRTVHAKATFSKLDMVIFKMLWRWARIRHMNKSLSWIKERYWNVEGTRNWIFSDGIRKLKVSANTQIKRHRLIKFDANPYLLRDRSYYRYRRA